MAKTQADFVTQIKYILQDDANIIVDDSTELTLKALLTDAVELYYDKDHPYVKYKSYTGTGEYDYTKPSDWIDGFSRIDQIEYPAGEQEPVYLDPEKYRLYHNGTTEKIRFIEDEPAATETFIVAYIIPHTLNASSNTTYEADFQAICHLTTGLALLSMANKFANDSKEPTINASVVEWRGKADRLRSVAQEHFKAYERAMRQGTETEPAITIREYDTTFPWGGEFLTHPKAWR